MDREKVDHLWPWALIGGMVGGLALATAWHLGWQTEKSMWDIGASLGTVASSAIAVVACWIAHRTLRRTVDTDERRARLIAGKWLLPIQEACNHLDDLHFWADGALSTHEYGEDGFGHRLERLRSLHERTAVPDNDLLMLAALNNDCASRLVQYTANLKAAIEQIDQQVLEWQDARLSVNPADPTGTGVALVVHRSRGVVHQFRSASYGFDGVARVLFLLEEAVNGARPFFVRRLRPTRAQLNAHGLLNPASGAATE